MIESDIVIIGGGAAGMMSAAIASDSNLSVMILEKKYSCGKKLLITGKGRCNLTNANEWEEFANHIHPDSSFFKTAFFNFSNKDVVAFFESIGLRTKLERGMRIFPLSDKSYDVLDSLLWYLNQKKVIINYNSEVTKIVRSGDGFLINVEGDNNMTVLAKSVIITTGGCSYPSTGSTGDGYKIGEMLGHKTTKIFPALTALTPLNYDMNLCGILLKNVRLDLIVNGGMVQSEFGELEFTNGGIEGSLGFRVSRKAVKAIDDGQKVELLIDLKPSLSIDQINTRIEREYVTGSPLSYLLRSFLPSAMIAPFLAMNKDVSLKNVASKMKNWKFSVKSYVGYERAVVTAGGISLKEVSRKTMESKLVHGLFFAGEVLDLDGDTGGYNLQIAFSTGALAAKNAVKRLTNSPR